MTGSRAVAALSIGDRYIAFIDRHEVAWELSFAALVAGIPADVDAAGQAPRDHR